MRPGNVRRCLRKSQIKGRLRIRQENIPEGVKTQAESGGHAVLAGYLGKSSYRYTPFGELVCAEGENAGEGFLYNGEAYDAVSGSYYLRARFYEPAAMRFNQPDTVRGDAREPQSLNRYVYVQNNPVMYEDPSGEILVLVGIGIGLAVGGAYAGYKYQNNRNRQQGVSGARTGTGTKTPKSTAGYTGTAKQNKNQSSNQGSSSYQSTGKQTQSKNYGYTTNTGSRDLSGSQQKNGSVPAAARNNQKIGTVQKNSGTKSSSKACSASKNSDSKKKAVLVPNKAVKTGTAIAAPVVVELLPQAWPWIVAGGKVFISALAGMGIVTLVGELLESKGDEKEGRVEPEGEVSEENQSTGKAKEKDKNKEKDKAKKTPNETVDDRKLDELTPEEINKLSPEELKEKLPDGWKYEEHNGRIHIKDPNGRMRLRIDPADKMTPYQHMHLYDNKGNLLDINGNPVPSKSPDGHIFYQP